MNKRFFSFQTVMPFGKYKGRRLGDLKHHDPGYLAWMVENFDETQNEFANEILDFLDETDWREERGDWGTYRDIF